MSTPETHGIDVAYIANLARLDIAPEAMPGLQKDMEAIVNYIDELSELDVTGVEPTAHATERANVWREDASRPGYGRSEILDNAPAIVNEELIKVAQVLPGEGMN